MHKYQTHKAQTYRIDKTLLPGIDSVAKRLGISKNDFINAAIAQGIIDSMRQARGEGK